MVRYRKISYSSGRSRSRLSLVFVNARSVSVNSRLGLVVFGLGQVWCEEDFEVSYGVSRFRPRHIRRGPTSW